MSERKECPLCGEAMHLKHGESVIRIPGNPNPTTKPIREWVCPECDYFEEAEEEDRETPRAP